MKMGATFIFYISDDPKPSVTVFYPTSFLTFKTGLLTPFFYCLHQTLHYNYTRILQSGLQETYSNKHTVQSLTKAHHPYAFKQRRYKIILTGCVQLCMRYVTVIVTIKNVINIEFEFLIPKKRQRNYAPLSVKSTALFFSFGHYGRVCLERTRKGRGR